MMAVTATGMPKMNGQYVDVVDAFNHIGVSMADRGPASEKDIIFLVILS